MASGKTLPWPADILSRYNVVGEIGAELRLAFDKKTGRKLAIKQVRSNAPNIENILKEVNHSHVVVVKERVKVGQLWFVVMEFMEGGDLSRRVVQKKGMPEGLAKFYFYQMVLAVDYLHREEGLAHQNIKSRNVLLRSAEDYCLARLADHGPSRADARRDCRKLRDAWFYEAPEARAPGPQRCPRRSDVYSLAVLLLECLAGRCWGNRIAVAYCLRCLDVSAPCKDLLRQMLVCEPDRRIDLRGVLRHEWLQDQDMRRKVEQLTQACKPSALCVGPPRDRLASKRAVTFRLPARAEGRARERLM
ncbi:serine/threonine-protein kinase Chk2-like isoform X2 [Bacillus rossius redtenbacheri]